MKKQKQSAIRYPDDKKTTDALIQKVSKLIEDAIPDNILGMLATAKEHDHSLIFYNRWQLKVHDKHHYEIIDQRSGDSIYNNICLITNAIKMVFHLNHKIKTPRPLDRTIYDLDEKYYRCLYNINFYKTKMKTKDSDSLVLFSTRYVDSVYKLEEIKQQLSKVN
jgi:hypothetical protein